MASNTLSMLEVSDQVRHWLETPVEGYLGSGYGNDVKALLQQPQNSALADSFIQKLIADVPVLAGMPAGAVNVYLENIDKERQRLIIDLNGTQVATEPMGSAR